MRYILVCYKVSIFTIFRKIHRLYFPVFRLSLCGGLTQEYKCRKDLLEIKFKLLKLIELYI